MAKLLREVEQNRSYEDLKQAILYCDRTGLVWSRMEPVLCDIRAIADSEAVLG